MNETRKVVLWQDPLKRGSEAAYLFWTFPAGDANRRSQWIPHSIVHHVSRDPLIPGETEQRCTVEVEEWFCEKDGL